MKRFIFFIVLLLVITAGIFTQEKADDAKNNWISGELGFIYLGVRYERMLGPKLSLGLTAYISALLFYFNERGVDAVLRFYPLGKTFFIGIGMGYHITAMPITDEYGVPWSAIGPSITPELGWRIDFGKPGGFYIQPGIKLPLTFELTDKRFYGTTFIPFFGMGGSF